MTSELFLQIAEGQMRGYSANAKFGHNQDIDTATAPEDLWDNGGDYTGFPSQSDDPETVDVFSSNAADDATGTGAQRVTVEGLDNNWEFASESVAMDGTTPVATSTRWHRVNRVYVIKAGSGGENAGIITVRHTTTTANVFATVPVGYNQTTICAFTVPDGKDCYILKLLAQIGRANGSAGSAEFSLRVSRPGEPFRALRYKTVTTQEGYIEQLLAPIKLPPRTDVKVRIEEVSDNDTKCGAVVEYLLIDR